jgi:hypothetical protein
VEFSTFSPHTKPKFQFDHHTKKSRKLSLFGHDLQNHVHYSIFDCMVEKYMVTCSIYIVARIFECVVVVAEVYEYPDQLLSMGILVTQRLSDRTRST